MPADPGRAACGTRGGLPAATLVKARASPQSTVGAWIILAALLAGCVGRVQAYYLSGPRWTTSTITVHLQLGSTSGPLMDGSSSWAAVAEEALSLWNPHLSTTRFVWVRDSTASIAPMNNTNNVHFSADVYGDSWGSGVLAVAIYYTSGGGSSMRECDVLFNKAVSWNSYRGPQQSGVYDFRRVALHEFGHVLGLHHPDAIGQSVAAIMNSRIGHLDTLAEDDINGARALYGGSTTLPPSIVAQPASQTAMAGQTVSFSVNATGTAPLSYQWLKGGSAISGANASTLALMNVTLASAGTYAVTVSNSAGSLTSAPASLTVNAAPPPPPVFVPPPAPVVVAPAIAVQPASRTVDEGASVTFSVVANGSAPLTYRWQKAGVNISGATTPAYTISAAKAADSGAYAVVVSNSVGSVTSSSAILTVNSAPVITAQPADTTAVAGASITLAVTASGSPAPTYQWQKDNTPLAGATSSTHRIESAGASDAGLYSVRVANSVGAVVSSAARVIVHVPPSISAHPAAQIVAAGSGVTFMVEAGGSPAPAYQWFKDALAIPGATNAVHSIASVQPSDAGEYWVVVTNAAGAVTSMVANLGVSFSRLVNLSTRGLVMPGLPLTTGFVVRGPGSKELVIRAIGPTLQGFGVGGPLADPRLEVMTEGAMSPSLSNRDWSDGTMLASAFASVGAFPLLVDSKDAAISSNFPPQTYSVRVTAGESTPGIALVEIYDADPLASATRLINVSTLGFAGAGENALTPGMVIRGSAPKRLLIRAVGPGLIQFGVADVLADPQLRVIPLGGSGAIAANDDWGATDELKSAFAEAGAFPLENASRDAAVIVTLEPGAYSVVVAGAGGATGTALVEVYDLDP